MAIKTLMTWVPKHRRWAKNVGNKNYAVSCKQLGMPPTKEGSWRAANQWWLAKQAQLEAESPPLPSPHPYQAELNLIDAQVDWATQYAPDEVAGLSEIRQAVEATPHFEEPPLTDEGLIATNIEVFEKLIGVEVPKDANPEVFQHFFGTRHIWADRLKRSPNCASPVTATTSASAGGIRDDSTFYDFGTSSPSSLIGSGGATG